MKKILTIVILIILMHSFVNAQEIAIKPYVKGDWSSVLKSANGQPMAVHFWGVTCPPCVKEMPQWGAFVRSNESAKVAFIQVDDVPPELMRKMLDQAKLSGANNYYIASPFDERLRYEIDPKWRGETPITIFIDKNGKKQLTVGSVNFQLVKKWFKNPT